MRVYALTGNLVFCYNLLFLSGEGRAVTEWLRRSGAREIARSGSERLFAIRAEQ
jgi:hypothetical protein